MGTRLREEKSVLMKAFLFVRTVPGKHLRSREKLKIHNRKTENFTFREWLLPAVVKERNLSLVRKVGNNKMCSYFSVIVKS